MNKKSYIIIVVLLFVLFFGIVLYEEKNHNVTSVPENSVVTEVPIQIENQYPDLIQIDTPKQGSTVSSPISVSGKARGTWYFEASAPVDVTDANGISIGKGYVTAQGEWMTVEFVPFTGTITLSTIPTTKTGFVIFRNDNPSGDPKTERMVKIPVNFK